MPESELRVLVVDDDVDLAESIRDLLKRRFGLSKITLAHDGIAAMSEFQAHVDRGVYFDLVVCDWNMPKCNGLQVLRWIRSRQSIALTPFVFLTAVAEAQDVLDAIESGATDYVMKPLQEDVVVKKIGAVLAMMKLA